MVNADKDFQKFLENLKKQNNIIVVNDILQTKYQKEIAGEDEDKREKQLTDLKQAIDSLKSTYVASNLDTKLDRISEELSIQSKLLKELGIESNDTKAQSQKTSDDKTEVSLSKESSKLLNEALKSLGGNFKNFSETIKEKEKLSLKEETKLTLAGTKLLFKDITQGLKTFATGAKNAATNPLTSAKAALGSVRDVLGTSSNYSPEREGFAKAYSKSAAGTKFQKDGKGSIEVGGELFDKLKSKENKILDVEQKIKEQTDYGFAPNKKDIKQLEKLQNEAREIDPRIQTNNTNTTKNQTTSNNQIVTSNINAEADNILSTDEIIADNSEKQTELFADLLSTTKESVDVLKQIKELLKIEPIEQQTTKVPEVSVKEESGPSLLESAAGFAGDLLGGGNKKPSARSGKPSKLGGALKSIGSKALSAAKFLGPVAAVAGAAYSGFSGYQNTGENFDLKEGQEATTGQKISSTLGGIASGLTFGLVDEKSAAQGIQGFGEKVGSMFGFGGEDKKADKEPQALKQESKTSTNIEFSEMAFSQKDPENYKKFVEFRDQKTEELTKKNIESGQFGKSEQGKQIAAKAASVAAKTEAIKKFQKEIEAAGAGKVTTKTEGKAGSEQTSKAVESTASKDAVAPKKEEPKTIGTRIKEFFGFGKKEEPSTAKPLESVSASKPKTVEELAMEEAKTYGRDKPNAEDMKAAAVKFKSQALGGKSEGELSGVSTLPMTTNPVPKPSTEKTAIVSETSKENQTIRDESTIVKPQVTPSIVSSNNVSNNTKVVPIKANPHPANRGSALDNYVSRISTF